MAKRILVILILIMLVTVGCSSEVLLSDHFNMDLEQVKSIIEESHKEETLFNDEEEEIINRFKDKYKYGQYDLGKDKGYYEMNDLEKAVYNETIRMSSFINEYDFGSNVLKSDQEAYTLYGDSEDNLRELLEIKNIEKLPEKYKGKYPTYERIKGLYPKKFKEDLSRLVEKFELIINGSQTDIGTDELEALGVFFDEYDVKKDYIPTDYKQEGKYYLVNSQMKKAMELSQVLLDDINEEIISGETTDKFNKVKRDLELLD